jgi:hypothetical protein
MEHHLEWAKLKCQDTKVLVKDRCRVDPLVWVKVKSHQVRCHKVKVVVFHVLLQLILIWVKVGSQWLI